MTIPNDDELIRFDSEGPPPLPDTLQPGFVEHAGARIWYAAGGTGAPVILLHGGLGNSGNWGCQVPALLESGCQVVVIDSRGHGRSTRTDQPFSYDLMASDVLAVMDALDLPKAAFLGWSDGACTALVLASKAPERAAGVFFFACNMDPSGARETIDFTPTLQRCISRHVKDYRRLSATPDDFEPFSEAVGLMQRTQPNYTPADLARIRIPVTIAHNEFDEFIYRAHAEYLARTIPGARFVFLPGVSHFAPIQQPALFNRAVIEFLPTDF